jgi:hypothetical protein
VTGAMLGAQGLVTLLRRSRAEHHQVMLVGLAVVAAIIPAIGLGWFVLQGPGTLADSEDSGIPRFMTDEAKADNTHGVLVIKGDTETGLTFTIRRGAGNTLGRSEIQYASEPDAAFTRDVRALVSRPTAGTVDRLAAAGISYIVLPAPVDGSVAAGLDATDGLGQAGTESLSTRTWQVETPVDPAALDGPSSWVRSLLLVVSALGTVTVAVLCLPTLRARRTDEEEDA